MNRKAVFLACFLLLQSAIGHAADPIKVDTKVAKVTVFLNGAQVTRTANVSTTAGLSTIVFQNISADIDEQSLQVHAAGAFTILSVKRELNFLNAQTRQKRVEELQTQQKLIRDQIQTQTDLLDVYKQEENTLNKNQTVNGQNTDVDIVKLKALLDFQTERLSILKKKEQSINNDVAKLNEQVSKIDQQIAEISKGVAKTSSDIIVLVSAKAAVVNAPFTLSYLVHNAAWYPTYDIRAQDVNSPITIAYKANVSQQCGEDWKDVKLTLSTGNPSVSGNKPELSPDYLNFGMYYSGQAQSITRVTGRVTGASDGLPMVGVSVAVVGTSIATTTDVNGSYSIQIPSGSQSLSFRYIGYQPLERRVTSPVMNVVLQESTQMLQDVAIVSSDKVLQGRVAGVAMAKAKRYDQSATVAIEVQETQNQTNVEFAIANPYTISNDGKGNVVEIGNYDLDATYQYYTAPKLNTDVFLTAQVLDWNKYNFISGEANLFFEGTYIGKSLLDTHTSADTLNLSLGTDKNIIVTRTAQKILTERRVIGSNTRETKDWLIEIKNRKNQPINLLVEDQVPVAQNTAIEVEQQELSGAKVNPNDGKVSWNLKLDVNADKKLELRYQVKYPKNQAVIVQ